MECTFTRPVDGLSITFQKRQTHWMMDNSNTYIKLTSINFVILVATTLCDSPSGHERCPWIGSSGRGTTGAVIHTIHDEQTIPRRTQCIPFKLAKSLALASRGSEGKQCAHTSETRTPQNNCVTIGIQDETHPRTTSAWSDNIKIAL